jgi:hypothetical protein
MEDPRADRSFLLQRVDGRDDLLDRVLAPIAPAEPKWIRTVEEM